MDKKIIQLFAGALLMMFYTSCTNEVVVEERSEGIKLHISSDISKTRASVDPGSNDENKIENIAVWFFQSAAKDSSKPLLYHLDEKLDIHSDYDIEFKNQELEAAKMSSNGTYDIYIVTVPTDKISSVKGIATLKDLKDIIYEGEYVDSSKDGRPTSPFIMSGCLLEHNFADNHVATVTLVRLATRLHISLANETGFGTLAKYVVTIEKDAKKVGLFVPFELIKGDTVNVFLDTQKKQCMVTEDKECTAYINEYMGEDSVVIRVQAFQGVTEYNWRIPIVYDSGKTQLLRNTSYELNLNLKPYSATISLNALSWELIEDGEQSVEPDSTMTKINI